MVEDLNAKQKRFCEEYVIDLNGTQAAIRAGYSEKTANEQASALLAKLSIQNYIAKLQEKKAIRINLKADDVINEIRKIAFADIKDFASFDKDGVIFYSSDKVDGTVISEVTSNRIGDKINMKFKLHDKMKALEMLGKHLRIFGDEIATQPVKIKITLPKEFVN